MKKLMKWLNPFRELKFLQRVKMLQKIRNKLLISILSLSIIPIIILGFFTYKIASNSLMARAFDKTEDMRDIKIDAIDRYLTKSQTDMQLLLETVRILRQEAFDLLRAVRTLKKDQIENYFNNRLNDIQALSSNPAVIDALNAFVKSKAIIKTSKWDSIEKTYCPWFAQYMEEYGFIDMFLISTDGNILYTVEKQSDLGQNLINGNLSNGPAGKAFRKGKKSVSIQDFEAYEPSGGVPAAFIAAPVISKSKTIGVVMIQIPIEHINKIMLERTGLGETGETYLVGSDKLFRSDSRFFDDSTILDPNYYVNTEGVTNALSGQTGERIFPDYNDQPVLSAYAPIDIAGLEWSILAEISISEAFTPRIEDTVDDFFTTYTEQYGYYDFYLFNPDGYLFYTVQHEKDFKTNMFTGEYKDTNLSHLVQDSIELKQFQRSDFEKYAPSKNSPAAFVAQPLVYDDHVELVVAAQLSMDHINEIMREQSGLGETGETYIVGSDKLWRNDSNFPEKFNNKRTILNPEITVDTIASKSALKGNPDTKIINNYQNISVLSSWSRIMVQEPNSANPNGIYWAIISEITIDEVQQPVRFIAGVSAIIIIIATFLVILIAYFLSDSITTPILRLVELFKKIGQGNYQARAEVTSNDELGSMANSLNTMLDNTLALIQTKDERDALENSIMKLLEEISALAEGDLSVRAEVSTEMTGAIADSFNQMAQQLGKVVRDVKNATVEVSSTSHEIKTTTENLAETSEMQSAQISEAISAINEMATSIQQVAENATQSAKVSEQSAVNAKDGTDAVNKTNKAMDAIRENIQETARAIKRLGESSQEIGNIVQIINDIADRTSILALNASIQAAMAGDAGRGFAVVAEEVQRLAERSTNSTKQIDTLVKNIQDDINEAGTSMEKSIQKVVEGSILSGNAHTKLDEIENVSIKLAELIQSISMASKQQVRASENIAKTMGEVGGISSQTSSISRETAVSMQNLAETSDKLRVSVEAFKLEEEDNLTEKESNN